MSSQIQLNHQVTEFRVARESDCTVLIRGETGAGKTRLAQEIHRSGARSDKPFITVNLASLHEGTIESELFGHERGAFTGADRKRVGLLESANGGTIFLDEVAELSLSLQARLLEFLQARTVMPLGSNSARRLDVRVIAATHQNLEFRVKNGQFREDLFHRLRVVTLELKPLRELTEQFDVIIHSVLEEIGNDLKKPIFRISEEVADLLERHPLRGNYRELRHALEYATMACRSATLDLSDLPSWFIEGCETPSLIPPAGASIEPGVIAVAEVPLSLNFAETLARFEALYLAYVLERFRGRVNRTAREIGLSKATLIRRIRTHRLNPRFVPPVKQGGLNAATRVKAT